MPTCLTTEPLATMDGFGLGGLELDVGERRRLVRERMELPMEECQEEGWIEDRRYGDGSLAASSTWLEGAKGWCSVDQTSWTERN